MAVSIIHSCSGIERPMIRSDTVPTPKMDATSVVPANTSQPGTVICFVMRLRRLRLSLASLDHDRLGQRLNERGVAGERVGDVHRGGGRIAGRCLGCILDTVEMQHDCWNGSRAVALVEIVIEEM